MYDPLERVTGVRYNGSSNALSYTYWGDGGVRSLTDTPNNRVYSYDYDSRGRLNSQLEQYGGNTVRSYDATYDAADRQTKATYKVSPDWSGTLNGQRTYAWQYASGDGSLTKFTFPSTTTSCLTYTYDALKRLTKRTTTVTGTLRGSKEYTYLAGSGTNGTTTLVSQLKNKDGSGNVTQSYTYTYDNVGNILTVSGSSSESYTYDTHDKLKKAVVNGVTYTYTYDVNGNILSKSDGTNTDTYTYGNSVWVDLLTAYNGHAITYDTPGNPTGWYDWATMSWVNGRRLASIGATSAHGAMSFTYDADGLRLTKTVGGVTHRYLWQNGKLVSEAWSDKFLEFFYDEKGVPLSFLYRSSATADVWKYLYVTNLQGDVIGITTPDGESRAVYTYDPFGKPLTATGTMASINPLRYRGYYYDTESGLYYVKARYYDPEICRWISADDASNLGIEGEFVSYNLFAYCGDNPIVRTDPNGTAWGHWIAAAAIVAVCAIATVVTCGGFAAAAMAVGMVSSGVAAATTASTVAAAAFIGSSTFLGVSALVAIDQSHSTQEFADQGNWGIVAGTAVGALIESAYGYQLTNNTPITQSQHLSGTGNPRNNATPNGSYTKLDYKGNIYSYTEFDSRSRQYMRIDFQGRAHAGVLPHIHLYKYLDRGGCIGYTFDMSWELID